MPNRTQLVGHGAAEGRGRLSRVVALCSVVAATALGACTSISSSRATLGDRGIAVRAAHDQLAAEPATAARITLAE